MPELGTKFWLFYGREITSQELGEIKQTVALFPNLSRSELAQTICENLSWYTPTGTNKFSACLRVLEKLERHGFIRLPKKRNCSSVRRSVHIRPKPKEQPAVICELMDIGPVSVEPVADKENIELWNEYIEHYHYLGYKRPFGVHQRYFIISDSGPLGCILMSGAAKVLCKRDEWIGWAALERVRNLHLVINNSRFLIFPWVNVRNLASHALGQLSRRIGHDWFNRWGYRPVLLETFVDTNRYAGTSYRASGWIHLGMSSGRGMRRRGVRHYTTTPKAIYVQALRKYFRRSLVCGDIR